MMSSYERLSRTSNTELSKSWKDWGRTGRSRERHSPVYKSWLSYRFELLRTREKIGHARHMPVRSACGCYFAIIQGSSHCTDRNRTLSTQRPTSYKCEPRRNSARKARGGILAARGAICLLPPRWLQFPGKRANERLRAAMGVCALVGRLWAISASLMLVSVGTGQQG